MIAEDPTMGPDGWSHTGILLAVFWASLIPSLRRRRITELYLEFDPMCGPFLITLRLVRAEGALRDLATDHIIAATGYRFAARSLPFSQPLLRDFRCVGRTVAAPSFESSIPALYFSLLALPAPTGVTRNSVLHGCNPRKSIPGGMVLGSSTLCGIIVR
jgi:hypothetical protein